MSNTNKKNPAGATNTTEAIESIPKTSIIAYMGRTSWDYDPEMDDPA
ncbi:MAG: hypothetical protein ACTIA3_07880 [Corynebacterium casei]|uniref:Uncharacterized protein n=1 Tax=Corynebacterium casei UCMA 3821 TaxID=1110505 RepID=G7HU32_9CORY|nr:hypothetical protein [Corynebacterium casei]CCE53697.1 putative uncharacterized protein [Corynebacterium casei UCMA 3821]